jgi:hypothetical protein
MKKLLVTLLLSKILCAFGFDFWSSNMSLEDTIVLAKSKNMPFVTREYEEQIQNFNKFNFQHLKDWKYERIFYTSKRYFDEKTTVTLYFTQHSQKLYKLTIRWIHASHFQKRTKKEIESRLTKEFNQHYGSYRKIIDTRDGFHNYKRWEIDSNNTIVLKSATYHLSISYIDHPIQSMHIQERKKQKKKIDFIVHDANAT